MYVVAKTQRPTQWL